MKTKVLYFINGSLPTEDDFKLAKSIEATVCFRNLNMIGDDEKPEDCDFVTGQIPEIYSEFPEWAFEVKVQSNPIKQVVKVPKLEAKTETSWKPNH